MHVKLVNPTSQVMYASIYVNVSNNPLLLGVQLQYHLCDPNDALYPFKVVTC